MQARGIKGERSCVVHHVMELEQIHFAYTQFRHIQQSDYDIQCPTEKFPCPFLD